MIFYLGVAIIELVKQLHNITFLQKLSPSIEVVLSKSWICSAMENHKFEKRFDVKLGKTASLKTDSVSSVLISKT